MVSNIIKSFIKIILNKMYIFDFVTKCIRNFLRLNKLTKNSN